MWRIPLPSSRYLEGLDQTVGSAMDSRKQMQQFMMQQKLKEQAEQREQELQPFNKQKLKAEAEKAEIENQANRTFIEKMNASHRTSSSPSGNQSGLTGIPVNIGGKVYMAKNMDEARQIAEHAANLKPGESYQIPGGQPTQQQTSTPTNFNDINKRLESGDEVVIKQPDPDKAFLDDYAGRTMMGMKIQDVKTKTVDGVREDRYPSGKIVRQKVGVSPEEKARINLQAAEEKEQAKANTKQVKEIEKEASAIIPQMSRAISASNLLAKNKNRTGYLAAGKYYTGLADEDISNLAGIFGKMQADLAKDYSQKGTIYGTRLAGSRKPNIRFHDPQNIGLLNDVHEDLLQRYNLMAKDYKRLTGKDLPQKLPKFYESFGKRILIDPEGGEHEVNASEVKEALKKYPNFKLKDEL